MEDDWLEGPIDTPAQLTQPCRAFFCDYMSYMTFIEELFDIAKSADKSSKTLLDIISSLRPADSREDPVPWEQGGPYLRLLSIYRHVIAELVWCRGVDNFLTYIAELWGLVFRARPETLKSQRQERLDNILQFKSIDELVDHLAEKRVQALSYQGMRELRGTLLKELGFDLFPRPDRLRRAVLIIEDRNLITHNRGVVNNLYIQRTGADWVKPGAVQKPGLRCTQRCMRFLANAAVDIDVRAVAKFDLPAQQLTDECRECITKTHGTVPGVGECGTRINVQMIASDRGAPSGKEEGGPAPSVGPPSSDTS